MLPLQCPRIRRGFTLIEATVAMAITLIAASTLLLAIESTITAGDTALDRVIAEGMADQLLEDIRHCHYMSPGGSPTQYPLGPNSIEAAGAGWSLFDDTDDFDGLINAPPKDRFGKSLGTGNDTGGLRYSGQRLPDSFFAKWRQRVDICYVNPLDLSQRLSNGQTSEYRAAEVTIERADRDNVWETLARRRFVFAYLPPSS